MNTSTIVQKSCNYRYMLRDDGTGTIVLPRRIAGEITDVLRWPPSEPEH